MLRLHFSSHCICRLFYTGWSSHPDSRLTGWEIKAEREKAVFLEGHLEYGCFPVWNFKRIVDSFNKYLSTYVPGKLLKLEAKL